MVFLALSPGPAWAQTGYLWKNVSISGAGAMVTGVYYHPLQQNLIYIRTDVGGAYRWDPAGLRWVPLNDGFVFEDRNYFGCEGFAVDPASVNVVYYAGGLSTGRGNGAIFKSTNQGASWAKLSLAVPMGGNMDRRWAGERLAVSPSNRNVILFGSRTQGMHRSTDAGATWSQVASSQIPIAGDSFGVQSIAFDPTSPGRVYAAVSTHGVYVSNDNGATWSPIGGSAAPMRLEVAPNGAVWYTHRTGVSKYLAGTWTNYSVGGSDIYMALAINPTNASDVIVSKGEWGTYSIWRTLNAGTTWTQQATTLSSTATWNQPTRLRPCDMVFDPFNPSIVWANQWRTTNVNANTVAWVQLEEGHEEDVAGAAIAPPSGFEFLVGVYDDDGFALDRGLDRFPTKQLGIAGSWNGHTWDMAYQETNPFNMVRVGGQPFYGGVINVAKSSDGGTMWNRINNFPANLFPLACAMSATNPNNIVVICNANYSSDSTGRNWTPVPATNPWRYTTDGGTTWNVVSGLPTPPAPYGPWFNQIILAADPVNGSKFYYSAGNGRIYRSTNGGASFTWVNTGSGQLLPAKQWIQIHARPGVEGELWACVDNDTTDYQSRNRTADEGLYRSTDGGATRTKISSVTRAVTFGFGAPPLGATTPALYLYGRIVGYNVDSIFRSLDLGQTWVNIQAPNNYVGDFPYIVQGSRQTYGRVFIGTGGRGFLYGTGNTPYPSAARALPGSLKAENYDRGGEGSGYHDTDAVNTGGQYRADGVDIEAATDTGGGYNVCNTAAGEWLKYTVSVATPGTFTVTFRVAATASGGSFRLLDQRLQPIATVSVPATGGSQSWTNLTRTVSLPAGQQTLTLRIDTGGFNLRSIAFTSP